MRKVQKVMSLALAVLGAWVSAFGFSACEQGNSSKYEAHIWAKDWEVIKEATCTEAGERRRFCFHCNEYKTETIAPSHLLEYYEGQDATCTNKGWTAYAVCRRDGCNYNTYQEIEKMQHEYEGDACVLCGLKMPTEGLVYEPNDEGGYTLTGVGECQETSVVIAAEYEGLLVTQIAPSAFEDCAWLEKVHISENVTKIGKNAFMNCRNLLQINMPSSLQKIEENAFLNCQELEHVIIEDVAAWCGVEFEKVKNDLYCSANPLLQSRKFYTNGKVVTKLAIPDSVTKINAWAFYHCEALKEVRIGENVQVVGEYAFYDCRYITNLTLGRALTTIERSAFYACKKLTSIVCPDSLEEIGNLAFYNCLALQSVTLTSSLKRLGKNAFQNCAELVWNEYEGGRYLSIPENPYFALIEWSNVNATERVVHPDAKVVFEDLENA